MVELLKDDQDVLDLITNLLEEADNVDVTENSVGHILRDIKHLSKHSPRALMDYNWKYAYGKISKWALEMLGLFNFHRGMFAGMLMQKQAAYGPKPIISWGNLGVMIRIDSKFLRMQNLKAKGLDQTEGTENIFDTIQDILGYCILGYRYDDQFKDAEID